MGRLFDLKPEYTLLSPVVYFGIGILGGMMAGSAMVAPIIVLNPDLWLHLDKSVFLVEAMGGGIIGLLFWWKLRLQSDWVETKRQAAEPTPSPDVMATFYFPPRPDLAWGEHPYVSLDYFAEAVNRLEHSEDRRIAYASAGMWAMKASIATKGLESSVWLRQGCYLYGAAYIEDLNEQRAFISNQKEEGGA